MKSNLQNPNPEELRSTWVEVNLSVLLFIFIEVSWVKLLSGVAGSIQLHIGQL